MGKGKTFVFFYLQAVYSIYILRIYNNPEYNQNVKQHKLGKDITL